MDQPLVQLKGVCKSFSGNPVLKSVDMEIRGGEVLCLAGENGCGKSTLIKIISGVYTYDAGELHLQGKFYEKITPTQSIDLGIQIIYQDFSLFPNLTVAENIALSTDIQQKNKRINWKRNRALAKQALDKIGVELELGKEVGLLPIAQKQIAAISRAILQDAKLIIMDEPTTALTQKEIEKLFEIIRGLKQKGISILFVSHKLDEMFAICDRIMVLRNGEKVVDQEIASFPRDKLVYYMTGKEIQEAPFECGADSAAPVLEAVEISSYPSFDRVSFSVAPGEILAITGQLGSGRTELATALFGITPIHSGELIIDGRPTVFRNQYDALKHRIAYLPEDRLTEGLLLNRSLGDNFSGATIDGMKNKFGVVPAKKLRELSDYWLNELNMSKKPYTEPAGSFSGGNQQRIVLGKWLAANPRVFVMNCPSVGVDVKSKSEIHAIMKRLANSGMAIIMISDDIGEILAVSNRIIVMNAGRVTFTGETKSVSAGALSDRIIQNTVGR